MLAVGACALAAVAVALQLEGIWITVVWSAEAVFLLALSARLHLEGVRWFAYLLLAAMLVRLAAVDTFDLDLDTFRPVLNWRFLAFAAGIGGLYSAAWLVRRGSGDFASPIAEEEARAAPVALIGLANLATIWLLSAEIIASADSALLNLPADVSDNVSELGLEPAVGRLRRSC